MSASILVVDEPEAELQFRHRSRREICAGTDAIDLKMSQIDRPRWLGELQAENPDLPVMMVTADCDQERWQRARRAADQPTSSPTSRL